MITEEIQKELFRLQDEKYRDFQGGLIPGQEAGKMIGVRTPQLRALAKEFAKREDVEGFLLELPHAYFEENQLHAFVISEMKDYAHCLLQLSRFLPFVDNWATCDQMSPKVFKKHRQELLPVIGAWLEDAHPYTVRFGIKMLMEHFLDADFSPDYLEWVAKIQSEEYYVKMMAAWYFATALAKQYEAAFPVIAEGKLDLWTHNKAIQKAIESRRVLQEHKEVLRGMRRKG